MVGSKAFDGDIVTYPELQLLPTMRFDGVVNKYPNKVAVISLHGVLTYSQLCVAANQLAWHLQKIGVGPEDVVAVSLERGNLFVVAIMAIWKANGAYLPLDISMPSSRMDFMISDGHARCIITTESVARARKLDESTSTVLLLDDIGFIQTMWQYPLSSPPRTAQNHNLAYVLYTSGTSGKPKGVGITHHNLINLVNDIQHTKEIVPDDRVMVFSPFCFDATIRDIAGTLLTGATLYIPDQEEVLPGNFVETLQSRKITNVVVTPSVLQNCRPQSLPLLRMIVTAGEKVGKDIIQTWGKGRILINAYGPTEATVCCAKKTYHEGELLVGENVSIGVPILNTKIHILDSEGRLAKNGVIGEIYISGPSVSSKGYLNLPELNNERFFNNMYMGVGRTFRTGDLGRLTPCGDIECVGRKDSQIKLHGQRIESEEITELLLTDPAVLGAIIVLEGPNNDQYIACYVVRTPTGILMKESDLSTRLDSLLRKRLPSYSIPSTFLYIDSIPTTISNKVDLKALHHATLACKDKISPEKVGNLTPFERVVATALLDAMGLAPNLPLNAQTTYSELGGTSLQAAMVLQSLNHILKCKIKFAKFYRRKLSVRDIASLATENEIGESQEFHAALQQQPYLPQDISFHRAIACTASSQRLMLTGATGFLGAHVLSALLEKGTTGVVCLVRSTNKLSGLRRVEAALKSWSLWKNEYMHHIDIIPANISQAFLGMDPDKYILLAQSVHEVWHCAAEVSFVASYADLEGTNVDGMREVLRFSNALTTKRLIYVSTLAVFFGARNKVDYGEEKSTAKWGQDVVTGYGQTKWIAEQMVVEFQDQGGDVLIFRPGRLLGSLSKGLSPSSDLTMRLLSSFIEIGVAPSLSWYIDFTPVDLCAEALIDLASSGKNGIYHFINPRPISLVAIVEQLNRLLKPAGRSVTMIPYQNWKQKIMQSVTLRPLSALFTDSIGQNANDWSVLDALLDTTTFRRSSYSIRRLQEDITDPGILKFPGCSELLARYMAQGF